MENGSTSEHGVLVTQKNVDEVIRNTIEDYTRRGQDDSFYVVDLNNVIEKYNEWRLQLPRVHPFYAIKCNHDPLVLATLASLGAGFDCCSKGEIMKALQLNVPSENIIYANPCKQPSDLPWAERNDISMMTFDNESELHKIKKHFPYARLVLRIRPNNAPTFKDRAPINMQFGARTDQARYLLTAAKQLGLNVIGISFHAGSDKHRPSFFGSCIRDAKLAFDIAQSVGYDLNLLDIGGGFTSHPGAKYKFSEVSAALRSSLDECFPESSGVRIIAEPGRFMVSSAFVLLTNVIARRELSQEEVKMFKSEAKISHIQTLNGGTVDGIPRSMYFINAGMFQVFSLRMVYGAAPMCKMDVYNPEAYEGKPRRPCLLWGPSCAPIDFLGNCPETLPDMEIGTWIVCRDMGEYTINGFSHFGSFPFPEHVYIMRGENMHHLET